MTEKLLSYEPATGSLLWEGEHSDVTAEVERAASAWMHWAAKPATFRIETMRRFANVVRAKEEELADIIARETGKPLWEAHTEVTAVIGKVDISIAAYSERTGQRRLEGAMGAKQNLRHKPHGVMAVLGPYNFPAHLPNGHIVPALIAGNGIVFKPSEKTPATAAMLVDLYHEAGVPRDLVRLVIGGSDAGKALVEHPLVNGILFTGSARTGIAINRALASNPEKIVALEMGGNNPIVVWDTPDLATAATVIVQSAFTSAGQRCTAARRLILRDSMTKPLMDELTKITDRLILDHPHADPAPFMGPVIDDQAADGLTESFLTLMSMGGKPVRHMQRPKGELPFVSPAIIDVTNVAERPDIELFGPLLQVVQVSDFDSAIREANATRYGLSASLLGGSPEQYDQFWASVRAGIVNWNGPTNGASSAAPFGGVGVSGNHRPSAYYAADYCAYPVASSEAEQLRASIGVGLAAVDTTGMGD
ncbi:MAG: succinylglutamate-semialdehyde dehydrogenase [Sphingobium sp.]|nr:succinylglutamate-semialdehyde dehydrogenase [Sphingobium sp.]MCP5398868.1 succinylglutamate-semialdehyde dehydrogenase [Sphingomonas sp.]